MDDDREELWRLRSVEIDLERVCEELRIAEGEIARVAGRNGVLTEALKLAEEKAAQATERWEKAQDELRRAREAETRARREGELMRRHIERLTLRPWANAARRTGG